MDFFFKGQFKESDAASKICAILNWLGDNAYKIYKHLHWAADDDKNDPEKVLKAFERYFKPKQNQFHSWYTLGSIYSSQLKCQHDFLMRLREVAHDCSLNVDEIVQFLFLTHNQNTHVREELLKLDTVKKDTQIDSTHHNKPKHDKSQGKGHGQQHCSNCGK